MANLSVESLYERYKVCSDAEALEICKFMCREIVSNVKALNKAIGMNSSFKQFRDFDVAFTAFLKMNGPDSLMNNFIGQIALHMLKYRDTNQAGGPAKLLDKFSKYLYDNYAL